MTRQYTFNNTQCPQLEEEKYHTKITTYREKIVPVKLKESVVCKKYLKFYSSEWAYITYTAQDYFSSEFDIWYFGQPENRRHPIIDKGMGYWLNDSEIVIGYRLRTNPSITRPIFNYRREINFRKVKLYIHRYLKFKMALIRQKMIRKELIKIKFLPIETIENILKYCYDPLLLL